MKKVQTLIIRVSKPQKIRVQKLKLKKKQTSKQKKQTSKQKKQQNFVSYSSWDEYLKTISSEKNIQNVGKTGFFLFSTFSLHFS